MAGRLANLRRGSNKYWRDLRKLLADQNVLTSQQQNELFNSLGGNRIYPSWAVHARLSLRCQLGISKPERLNRRSLLSSSILRVSLKKPLRDVSHHGRTIHAGYQIEAIEHFVFPRGRLRLGSQGAS